MNFREVWLSYLDDPTGPEALAIRKMTQKFWDKNSKITKKIHDRFGSDAAVGKMLQAKSAVDLFAEVQSGGNAITNLLNWCNRRLKFLALGDSFSLPGLDTDSVHVYTLGPPVDGKLLGKLRPSQEEEVHGLQSMNTMLHVDTSSSLMLEALDALSSGTDSAETENFPFNKKFNFPMEDSSQTLLIKNHYLKTDAWRRIDHQWLSEAGRLSPYGYSYKQYKPRVGL